MGLEYLPTWMFDLYIPMDPMGMESKGNWLTEAHMVFRFSWCSWVVATIDPLDAKKSLVIVGNQWLKNQDPQLGM